MINHDPHKKKVKITHFFNKIKNNKIEILKVLEFVNILVF